MVKRFFLSNKLKITIFSVLVVFFTLISNHISNVNAQTSTGGSGGTPPSSGTPLEVGDVSGFAWMGQNINAGNQSEGGGGWLNMNCKTSNCVDADGDGNLSSSEKWGTRVLLDHGPDNGLFTGHAWSSHYGWLSFDEDIVSECWQNNPYVTTESVAKAMVNDPGPEVPVYGWARFVNGMDFGDDRYDGCVSFNGLDHGVTLNMNTGVLSGWAWGGDVVGWLSFNNPECPFCNISVLLPNTVSINFWADDNSVNLGGGTTLRWQANDVLPNRVASCRTSNTSNYSHWSNLAVSGNVGEISIGSGKLPSGNHAISGISQTTTYALACEDRFGVDLPVRYVTINVDRGTRGCMDPNATNYNPLATIPGPCTYGPIAGCTDPLASNFNPLATIDDGSCVDGGIPGCTDPSYDNFNPLATVDDGSCANNPNTPNPTLTLLASPSVMVAGSGDYEATLQWTENISGVFDSCSVGSAQFNGLNVSLAGWTNITQTVPNASRVVNLGTGITPGTLSASNAIAGDQYRFRLTCTENGNTVNSNWAVINIIDPVVSGEPPVVELFITEPDIDPSGNFIRENVSPVLGANPVTLRWTALNVESCVASSNMYNANVNLGANPQWDGQSLADDDSNNNTRDLTNITDPAYIRNTIFTISCIPENTTLYGNTPRTASVCMGLAGVDFPQCLVTGTGNIPSFEEI